MTDTATTTATVDDELEAIGCVQDAVGRVTKHDARNWLSINHCRGQAAWDEMGRILRANPALADRILQK